MKDLYEDFNSKYCYKNTNILINKLDIREYKELSKYEAKITAAKSLGLRLKGITGNYDKKHYLSIHNYLFEKYKTSEVTNTRRVICTPGQFTRDHFFYIQEAGYLKSLQPHLSKRSGLQSYLFMIVLSGSGTVTSPLIISALPTNSTMF